GNGLTRRGFLKQAGAAVAAAQVVNRAATARAASQATSKIRWGMIGTGGQGCVEIPSLLAVAGAEPAAICDIRPKAIDEAKKLLGDRKVKVYSDYRELVADKDVDIVSIVTPPHLHKEMTRAALEAGKHVYCEKPMAVTPEDLDEMVEMSRKYKPVLQIGAERRYSEIIREAVRVIHSGDLGQIRFIQSWWLNGIDYDPKDDGWIHDAKRSGDVMVEMVCHQIDVWNWLFKSTPTKAHAAGGINHYKDQPHGRTISDHFSFILEYPTARVSHCLTLYAGVFNGIKDRIMCSDGAMEIDLWDARYMEGLPKTWFAKPDWTEIEWPDYDALPEDVKKLDGWRMPEWASYKDFFACIREGRKPFCNAETAREFGLSSMMVRKAMQEQRPVTWDEMLKRFAR
ncbi:MAG: Gfo/Idh/MocA family oxidoreductase, partial [Planctomycetes bacterium]|nr:Gfo/Idh/MocA family oxidoreductase [Planctomycetota bacterium]